MIAKSVQVNLHAFSTHSTYLLLNGSISTFPKPHFQIHLPQCCSRWIRSPRRFFWIREIHHRSFIAETGQNSSPDTHDVTVRRCMASGFSCHWADRFRIWPVSNYSPSFIFTFGSVIQNHQTHVPLNQQVLPSRAGSSSAVTSGSGQVDVAMDEGNVAGCKISWRWECERKRYECRYCFADYPFVRAAFFYHSIPPSSLPLTSQSKMSPMPRSSPLLLNLYLNLRSRTTGHPQLL